MQQLTEEESRDGALELEQVADDCTASARCNGGGIDCCDVGEALLVLSIYGVPHQARRPKQGVLCPAKLCREKISPTATDRVPMWPLASTKSTTVCLVSCKVVREQWQWTQRRSGIYGVPRQARHSK